MDKIQEKNSWPARYLQIKLELHEPVLKIVIKSFGLSDIPHHTFFHATIGCFLCCSDSDQMLDTVKGCASDALNILCPQLMYDLQGSVLSRDP